MFIKNLHTNKTTKQTYVNKSIALHETTFS